MIIIVQKFNYQRQNLLLCFCLFIIKTIQNSKKLSMQKKLGLLCLLLASFINYISCFGKTITLDSSTSSSISTYTTNLAACQCDVTTNLCNNFCCCDTSCDSNAISNWQNLGYCLEMPPDTNEVYCDIIGGTGLASFEDLACTFYSNRGEIGYYYDQISASGISYPTTTNNFADKTANAQTLNDQQTVLTTGYTATSYINIKDSTGNPAHLRIYRPSNGLSILTPVKIGQSVNTATLVPMPSDCTTVNDYLSKLQICFAGQCVSTSGTKTFNPGSLGTNGGCNDVITEIDISYDLSSTGTTYTISNVIINLTPSSPQTPIVTISTKITVKYGTLTQLSGNPGYQPGKPVLTTTTTNFTIPQFIDKTTGLCRTTDSGSSIAIKFKQPYTVECTYTNDPCSTGNQLILDTIFTKAGSMLKYASGSEAAISIEGIKSSSNLFCGNQSIILNIMYSDIGWTIDLQNYIIGAEVTSFNATDDKSTPSTKIFRINWIYVDPALVATPPDNYFYEYFSKLWIPLKSSTSSLLQSSNLVLFKLMLLFLLIILI